MSSHSSDDEESNDSNAVTSAVTVSIGDDSVTTLGITDTLLVQDDSPTSGPSDFLSKMHVFLSSKAVDVFVNEDGVCLRAELAKLAVGGRVGRTSVKMGLVLPITDVKEQLVEVLDVTFREPETLGKVKFDRKETEERLASMFCRADRNIRYSLIHCDGTFYNNSGFYAKLIYYALLLDLFQYLKEEPVVIDFPAGSDVTIIDSNTDNASYVGGMCFLGDRFSDNDMQILQWVAKPGMRLSGKRCSPHACFLKWPAIDITVVSSYCELKLPAQAKLEKSLFFYSLAFNLANERNEHQSLLKGLYIALDVIGLRYIRCSDGRYRPLKSNLSTLPVTLVSPRDSALVQVLKMKPKENDEEALRSELLEFYIGEHQMRVHIAVIYSAVLSSATATCCYGFNVSVAMLSKWCTGDNSYCYNVLGILNNVHQTVMLTQPKRAFSKWLGCSVEVNLYPKDWWIPPYGSDRTAGMVYEHMLQSGAPHLFNPLILNDLLLVRPIEWGVCCPYTSLSLAKAERVGPGLGWFTPAVCKDVRTSSELPRDTQPMLLEPNGFLALNAFSQFLELKLPMKINARRYGEFGVSPASPAELPYDAELCMFEPLNLLTYDYSLRAHISFGILGSDLTQNVLLSLFHSQGPIQQVGLLLPDLFRKPTASLPFIF